jgi:hypothetical protein
MAGVHVYAHSDRAHDHEEDAMSFREGPPRAGRLSLTLAAGSLALAGCFGGMSPSLITFQGIKRPIMLSSVDRIGGGAPMPVTKVSEVEGQSVALFTSSTSSNGTTTTTTDVTKINNVEVFTDVVKGLEEAGPQSQIQITTLRAWARGWPTGVKNTVYIQGDVVRSGGGK